MNNVTDLGVKFWSILLGNHLKEVTMSAKAKTYFFLILFSIITLPGPIAADTSYQFDFLGFIKTAYDSYNKIKNFMEPDPNLADLINQAKAEILEEINLVRAEEQIGNVNALIDEYTIYLNNPPTEQTMEAWIRDAINVVNQFELIIQNKSPRIAYLSAKSYNMLIPLMALMMQREGIRTEDILPLFEDVITTNKALLGQYCWNETPNTPLYWDKVYGDGTFVGKLLKCYHTNVIDWAEYLNIYDIVWSANEELRKNTIERYEDIWFYISNEKGPVTHPISPGNNKYLYAHSRPHRTYAKVSVADLQPGDSDFLWKLEFQTAHLVKIVHWSGKVLAIAPDNKNLILTPAPALDQEIWSFNTWYSDRPAISANIEGEPYLTATSDSIYMWQRGVVPSAAQRWVIQFAERRNISIGSTAFPCPADYDGDGKADLGMKINDGRWLIDYADNGFGSWDQYISSLTDVNKYAQPAPADFDGDRKADICVKNDLTATWNIDYAANGFGSWDYTRGIGATNSLYDFHALPADYDGDGKADIALFKNYGGWSIDYSSDGFNGWNTYPHSWQAYFPNQDIYPAAADYDGDGKVDVGIKQDNATWLIDYAQNDFSWTNDWDWSNAAIFYGDQTVYPVPGYYNNDRYADIGIWSEDGRWMFWDVSSGTPNLIHFTPVPAVGGGKHFFPIPADYDGDGITDLSVIREDGTWFIDYSKNGFSQNLTWDWSSTLSMPTAVTNHGSGMKNASAPLRGFRLSNYPNPFNSSTMIHFSLSKPDHVTIRIYNIMGAEIATLVNETKGIGEYGITWDGRDKFGRMMPSGIYVYEMLTQNTVEINKMLLIK